MENWYLPITIVPGIGLLILSTSNLIVTLSNELSGLIKEHSKDEPIILRKLVQLKILNRAMVFFYISVACLAIAGIESGVKKRGTCAPFALRISPRKQRLNDHLFLIQQLLRRLSYTVCHLAMRVFLHPCLVVLSRPTFVIDN